MVCSVFSKTDKHDCANILLHWFMHISSQFWKSNQWVVLKGSYFITLENNTPSTLNLTLNLADGVKKNIAKKFAKQVFA